MITKMHVKKGDKVKVITGKNKGKEGIVLKAFPNLNRISIENINVMKKNIKAQKAGQKGSIIEVCVPIDASNVKKI
jgi:large subunit ribosomal protein L24